MQENYQPPAADVSPKLSGDSAEQDLANFVGSNAAYYLERFRQIERGGGASWHWPAFFVTSGWLLYRKMWFYAFAYIILLPVVLTIAFAALGFMIGQTLADLAFQLVYLGIAFIAMPMIANRLYLKHAKRRIAKVHAGTAGGDAGAQAIAAAGGTNLVAALLLLLVPLAGIMAAISIPAYQDYTIRAQISEGLSLAAVPKAAVSEYYYDSDGRLPVDNAAAGLPAPVDIAGNYVESVSVEDGAIYVSYGGDANPAIAGMTLYLLPVENEGALEWRCRSDDLVDRWLPPSCRD